jgi:hypothetical protein
MSCIVAGVDSQQVIDFNSTPWYRGGINDSILLELNPYLGYQSNSSVAIASDAWNWGIIQNIDYLDSDTVQFIDLCARSDGNLYGLKINIVYSDRSYTSKIINSTWTTTWQHQIFSNFITPSKYIIQIQIYCSFQHGGIVNIDNVGLWSSIQSDKSRFTWNVSPLPLNKTGFICSVRQHQNYVFTGKLYDINGELTEDGSFQVLYNSGSVTGTITNGVFSFSISERSGATDFVEEFDIQIDLNSEQLSFELTFNWMYSGSGYGTGGEGNIPNTNVPISTFINFVLLLCFIVLPAIGFGFYCGFHNVNPLFGFIGALTMLTAVGYLVTLVPLWFFATTIIVDVVLGLYIFNSSRSGVG